MTFLHAARATYDKTHNNEELSWEKYVKWSKLTHLTELVSLDGMLNENLVKPNYDDSDDWDYIHVAQQLETDFFTTVDFVFQRLIKREKYNLLAIVIEPDKDCKYIQVENYDFVGYELLDQDFHVSALSNCGGFDETFLPTDLNDKGLIDDFTKAYDIKKRLLENNPNEYHADTNVIAVWRHKTIGR